MLVLTRRRGEEIVIGHEVGIKVVESQKEPVRIGISAPRNLSIRRGEQRDEEARTRLGLQGPGPETKKQETGK